MRKTKKLFDDDDYALLQKSGPFGISWPVLCSYLVVNKARGLTLTATGKEKSYLLATLQHYNQMGGNPRQLGQLGLLKAFCEAVASRGGVIWQFFFCANSPLSRAKTLIQIHMP